MLERLAKPVTAKVAIATERSDRAPDTSWSWRKAMISLTIVRVPRTPPTAGHSDQGTPIKKATGARSQPSKRSRVSGAPAMSIQLKAALNSEISAMKAINIAPTLTASLSPSVVPVAAASKTFESSSLVISKLLWPRVSGSSVSGIINLEVTMQAGAVIATAASKNFMSTWPMVT